MIAALVVLLWLLLGVIAAGLAFALFQRRYPRRRSIDFRSDRWFSTVGILGGPVSMVMIGVVIMDFGYYGWLWPWCHEALEEAGLA